MDYMNIFACYSSPIEVNDWMAIVGGQSFFPQVVNAWEFRLQHLNSLELSLYFYLLVLGYDFKSC